MEEKLKSLINRAYAPYSKFCVGAIVVVNDGKMFYGVNVETSSYGGTICAERNAICNAISNGYTKGDFKEIHIMSSGDSYAMPCMLCRQFFVDFFDPYSLVYVYNSSGEVKKYIVKDLCPIPFSSEDIL